SSAVSPLSDEVLFYMMSRGLCFESARKMLIFSFFSDIITRLNDKYAEIIAASLISKKIAGEGIGAVPDLNMDFAPVSGKAEGIEGHYKYEYKS
ncbi:MAG: SufD family Fe-S cluster assembly protein, partial [Candidatus Micrarchaeaceae archaeon]